MTVGGTEPAIRRILVALDASSHSLAALEAAVELASLLQAEIRGLYVEDANLLRAAELPFLQQIGSASGIARPLRKDQLEHEFQVQARRARQALAAVAERARLPWKFRVSRGAVSSEVLASASEADLITLGASGWSPSYHQRVGSTMRAVLTRAPAPVLVLRRNLRPGRPVVVLYEGSPAGRRALGLGELIAQHKQVPLIILMLGVKPPSAPTPATSLASLVYVVEYPEANPERLAQFVRSSPVGMMIAPGSALLPAARLDLDWLLRLECPVLITQ